MKDVLGTFAVRGCLVLAGLALVAIVTLSLGHGESSSGLAQAEPEMELRIGSCSDDCEVLIDSRFGLNLAASAPPPGGFGGFQSEIHIDGMRYTQRACETEVVMDPLALCLGPTNPVSGEVLNGGITGQPPLPVPASSSELLVELAVTCEEAGEYEFALAALPSTDFGAAYYGVNGEEILLRTVGTRELPARDPDDAGGVIMVERQVADVLAVSCVTELTQDPTPTGEDGEGPEATATPPSELPTTGGGLSGGSSDVGIWTIGAIGTLLAMAGVTLGLLGWARGRRAS